ncbi:MAG: DsbA family protein, partial [Planctomycetota bacterium]|nr:DsbA family protein [Planctomycetota bacterium]
MVRPRWVSIAAVVCTVVMAGAVGEGRSAAGEGGGLVERHLELARAAEAAGDGVFGVPAFVVDGELIWGQDRLHLLADRLGAERPTHSTATPVGRGGRVRFFHDFASPFSYLGATQVERIAQASGAVVDWSPILLGALFRDIGTADVPLFEMSEPKRRYQGKDLD